MLDEAEKLFVKSVKEYLETSLQKVQNDYQFDSAVEDQLITLILLKNKDLNKIIKDYFDEQEEIKKDLVKILKDYSQKRAIYHDNVKTILEEIKKL